MKNNKGITLVALIITVIVVIIIAGISIGSLNSKNSINDSKSDSLLAELQEVQSIILETYIKYKQTGNDGYFIGTKTSSGSSEWEEAKKYNENLGSGSSNEYYYVLTSKQLELLGLKGSEQTYLVNYETGEVYNIKKFEDNNGDKLYLDGTN